MTRTMIKLTFDTGKLFFLNKTLIDYVGHGGQNTLVCSCGNAYNVSESVDEVIALIDGDDNE